MLQRKLMVASKCRLELRKVVNLGNEIIIEMDVDKVIEHPIEVLKRQDEDK